MTTPSRDAFEIRLRASDRDLVRRSWPAGGVAPAAEAAGPAIAADESFAVHVYAPPGEARGPLRLKLGDEVIAEAPAGARYFQTPDVPWFRNEFGTSRVVLERVERAGEGDEDVATLFELEVGVIARPEVARDYRVMLRDVAAVHEGLAQDVAGRSFARRRIDAGSVALLHPRAMLNRLREVHEHLQASIEVIAKQPSVALGRAVRTARYRGGDRVDAAAAVAAARDPATRVDRSGRVVALGKLLLRGPALTEDLPEHRHIAEGLRRLAARAEGLARHCEHTADRLSWQAARHRPAASPSPRDDGITPALPTTGVARAGALRRLAEGARDVGAEFRDLLDRHPFLANAGLPRTDFGPTPAFLGRPAYREVYLALLRARTALGVLVDGDDVRIAHRGLPTLYEYWCFLRVVRHLQARLGRPGVRLAFELIDDIYRPDLAPGQSFRFEAGPGSHVVVTYEPEFRPWRDALRHGDRFGSSLTREPLRPDITVEVSGDAREPSFLVLDAKSTDAFTPRKFREMADYARQVFDPRTGRQPVRQVFLLHRDRLAPPWENLPGYLDGGRPILPDASILGAIPCVPDRMRTAPGDLGRVLDRFLEIHGPPTTP